MRPTKDKVVTRIIERHWLSHPLAAYMGLEKAVCRCGEFEGTYAEYQLHLRAAHAVELAAFEAWQETK